MADLPPLQPSSAANVAVDSDDISSLLQTILHNSSQQSLASHPSQPGFTEPPGFLDPDFAFPGGYYSSGGLSIYRNDDAEYNSEEETRGKSALGRSSSKRSRAAEVHNMSEKRRRQRINEKMKALQKLIPNSNKTDKASMLDEAIDYLKQLQLHVQMLAMTNGSSSHPFYLPATAQPPSVRPLGEVNNSKLGSFSANQEASVQSMSNLFTKPASSDYKLLMIKMSENNNSQQAYVSEPSMNVKYRPFSPSMPSKVLCKDPVLPQLQLDMSQYGQSSSSGVSS